MERLKNVDYHVIDRCNLNCVSCGHFCPLVPKDTKQKGITQVHKDFRALSKALCEGVYLEQLTLTGGEVTLLPVDDLMQILHAARNYFPHSQLKIWTNGLKFHHFDSVANELKHLNVYVCMSDYAQATTEQAVEHFYDLLGEDHFGWVTRRWDGENIDFFRHFFSRFEMADLDHILNCAGRQECLQLQDEKLYICQYAAYSHYFNEYFGEHAIYQSDDMYIDLTKSTWNDIQHFIKSATPMLCKQCVDCLRPEFESNQKWKVSEKKMDEWMLP